ncbi:MAG: ATP-binding protein [Vicinamibacterales bacterium]
MDAPLRILYLEDDPADVRLIQDTLRVDGIAAEVAIVDDGKALEGALARNAYDLILADYALPTFDGAQALAISRALRPDIPFIFVTGALGDERAVQMLRNGATDYVLKDRLPGLAPAIRRATTEAKERALRQQAEEALHRAHDELEQKVRERTRELSEKEVELRTRGETLRALSAALLTAQEDERRRIARDLHDDVVQQLALLSIEIGTLAGDLPASTDGLPTRLRALQKQLVQVTHDVRRVSYGLHSSMIEDLGLSTALEALCEEFERVRGIHVQFDGDIDDVTVPATTASVFYRIAQESITNAAQHAQAREVHIELQRTGDTIELLVADDGAGFIPEQAGGHGGLGLVNMRERMRLVNGTLSVTSQPGRGTTIRASVPLERAGEVVARSPR